MKGPYCLFKKLHEQSHRKENGYFSSHLIYPALYYNSIKSYIFTDGAFLVIGRDIFSRASINRYRILQFLTGTFESIHNRCQG